MLRYFLSVMENLGCCSITIYYTVILKLVLLHAKYILFTDKFFVVVFISSEFYIEKWHNKHVRNDPVFASQ